MRLLKRGLTYLTITSYIGILLFGIFSHTFSYKTGRHPSMYYIVWDMFCGWSAFSIRTHIIGEGISGKYYELAPGPWGEYKPYGNLGRRHYDTTGDAWLRMAMNALDKTEHEPMLRILCIEEAWCKKYNLPDSIWDQRYEEPKDFHNYFRLRRVITPDGVIAQNYVSWLARQRYLQINDNPRLISDMNRARPFFAATIGSRVEPEGPQHHPDVPIHLASPVGN
ncbi:MAG: hypothetical protein K0U86_20060 [Planctomycetes bacterium]|nr:hypothetical protein [Planctomycetota bacterium]MCH9727197.1 hypothetical protein [Planctomycetota bacterium]MCH9778590.1 hypothetical protein [Planctomycetota bacterium]MCH9791489.1 hypothetical protein [Planctomycetota bacterium]MDF1742066.1 hypothetical protein [Gimesia sp.]